MMRKNVFMLGTVMLSMVVSVALQAQGRGAAPAPGGQGRGGGAPAATPRTQAPIDVTGYWVAIISEDWRWRMITPARGDFPSIPMTAEAEKVADAWNPGKE